MGLGAWVGSVAATARHAAALRRAGSRIVFLNQRWAHHGRRSGYLLDVGLGPSVAREDRLIPNPLVRWRAARTGDSHWEQRLLLWLSLAAARAELVHVIDGDFDTWAYGPRPSWARARVTATFHQPLDRLGEVTRGIVPGSLDGIICMSRAQIPALESLVPRGRCVFIPHGVETEFFRPVEDAAKSDSPVLLSVGAHRRDFPTLVAAARLVRARRPDARVRLVAPKAAAEAVRRDAGDSLEVLSGISDEELRAQYLAAAVLFLPLEAATANNALLEAMACALPSVITDVPDLHDYVDAEAAVFCAPRDPESHAAAALALLDDEPRRRRMGRAARAQAESLSWPKVRARAEAFFREVIAG